MAKKIFYDDDARRRLLGGAQAIYDVVKTTMGPKGRNVVISKGYGAPTVTHDGVTVAKGIDLQAKDDETLGYREGAELIKQAASKLNDVAGDGTTTVTILTYRILNEANRLIAAGHNPMQLRKELEHTAELLLAKLGGLSESVVGKRDKIAEVATISAGDAEIGQLIADVIEAVGRESVVTVEESPGLKLEKEIVEGFTMDRGYISPYLVTDMARMEAVYEKPAVLLVDKKITNIQELLPIIEKLAQNGNKDLLLVAEDVEGDALGSLILNKLKGSFNCVAVRSPSFGDRQTEILHDIAILTGGGVVSDKLGQPLQDATLEVIGTAKRVIVTKDETTIIQGDGSAKALKTRIANLSSLLKDTTNEYEREQLEKRRAALKGKVAIIKVGGASETEIEEKKYRVDDAVAATKASLEEGIVPGGGTTLVYLSEYIFPEALPGAVILRDALRAPFLQLMANAGLVGEAKLEEVLKANEGWGFDVNNPDELVVLKTAGIIDPTKVIREAIQSAVSIAGTAMTMGALVVDIPEENKPATPAPGGV